MKNVSAKKVEMVEVLKTEYNQLSQLPLTPMRGVKLAQILAKLAMLKGMTSIAESLPENEKGAPVVAGNSFSTSLGCTDDSVPF